MSKQWQRTCAALAVLLAACLLPAFLPLQACPFCDAPSITYSEQLVTADGVLLLSWESAVKPDAQNFTSGSTTYRVVEVLRSTESQTAGETITLKYYQTGKPGDLLWLLGTTSEGKLTWGLPVPMSRDCWDYIVQAPLRAAPIQTRLKYYANYLEHPDVDVAIDAYGEFAGSPYENLQEIAHEFSSQQVLGWLLNPETTPTRRGFYGLLLGLCGSKEDAKAIEPTLLAKTDEVRFGLDGMMAGYVLLTGETGLKTLADAKLKQPNVPPGEIFALLQTLRFLWQYEQDIVPPEQLKVTLRLVLDHPQYADMAIIDLARWKDWQLIPQLGERYGQGTYADADVRRAVIRFLMIASEVPAGQDPTPEASQAREYLEKLRTSDAATVKYVERHAFD
ncbi:hypothetical protein [Planctomicrobium piriforme]|uniref:Uncharacterized protein n=1 Tax=Planctomicrobium piriforme TaxID=1576369 RepID=A0A1I3ENH2_9PLAN|nr:hypothetical protein [Planctomicrobium piriforme]SFI00423.1 hypothetical protein SAMN05421753_104300 [Planctomicrobium piriforme]